MQLAVCCEQSTAPEPRGRGAVWRSQIKQSGGLFEVTSAARVRATQGAIDFHRCVLI